MSNLNIQAGKVQRPAKAVIFGPEGIGKSTLASQAPNPLFIDLEGGTSHMDVRRISPAPESFKALIGTVNEVAVTPGICKTLVIDTADAAEVFAMQDVCWENRVSSIEKISYGKGWGFVADKFRELLAALDMCVKAGINVIVIAHAKMRKFEEPDEMGAYDRWELKLSKQAAPLLKEWCDALLFCNYRNYVVTAENGTKKGTGGKRVVYTSHRPTFDAKNRFGLQDEMELKYENISRIFEKPATNGDAVTEAESSPLEQLRSLMKEADISADGIKAIAVAQGHAQQDTPVEEYPDKLLQWFITNWSKIIPRIRERSSNS